LAEVRAEKLIAFGMYLEYHKAAIKYIVGFNGGCPIVESKATAAPNYYMSIQYKICLMHNVGHARQWK